MKGEYTTISTDLTAEVESIDCCLSDQVYLSLCVDGKVVYVTGPVSCMGVELIVSCATHGEPEEAVPQETEELV